MRKYSFKIPLQKSNHCKITVMVKYPYLIKQEVAITIGRYHISGGFSSFQKNVSWWIANTIFISSVMKKVMKAKISIKIKSKNLLNLHFFKDILQNFNFESIFKFMH